MLSGSEEGAASAELSRDGESTVVTDVRDLGEAVAAITAEEGT